MRDRCLEESVALGVSCVNVCVRIDEDPHDCSMVAQNRPVEERVTIAIPCVNIGPCSDEDIHNCSCSR